MTPEIKLIKTQLLVPYARNARTHSEAQVDQIAASIREFGFTNPILIKDDMTIIAGHGRLAAAKKLQLDEVPTICLSHLSPTQVKAYILADNKLALNAGWDEDMLALEIKELSMEGFDVSLTGFDDVELSGLLVESTEEGLTDEDEVPEVPANPLTKPGDVWILGGHRVLCGDCLILENYKKLLNGAAPNMLHTDPPYGVSYAAEGHTEIQNDSLQGDEFTQFLSDALGNCFISLADGANAYVWHAGSKTVEFITAFKNAGFTMASPGLLQWVKSSLVMSQGDYHPRNEPCLYGWKAGANRVRVKDRTKTTVWEFDRPRANDLHPTMKPVELCEEAINNSSMKGQSVLDIFGGSGSTLLACEKTGRINFSMEIEPKYCDVIVKRWQEFTGKKAVLESSGELFDDLSAHETNDASQTDSQKP